MTRSWRERRSKFRPLPEPIDPDLPEPRAVGQRSPFNLVNLILVGVGGALGTLARYACSVTWSTSPGTFPMTILLVNLSGAFLIGVTLSVLVRTDRMGGPRLFSCVGVLGGWTTMSTAAVSADLLIAHGHVVVGLAYLALSVVGGAIATGAGIAITHRLARIEHS
jgi:fluoride exporter